MRLRDESSELECARREAQVAVAEALTGIGRGRGGRQSGSLRQAQPREGGRDVGTLRNLLQGPCRTESLPGQGWRPSRSESCVVVG